MNASLVLLGSTVEHRACFLSAIGVKIDPAPAEGQTLVLNNKYYSAEINVASLEVAELDDSSKWERCQPAGVILLCGSTSSAAKHAEDKFMLTVGQNADVQMCAVDLSVTVTGDNTAPDAEAEQPRWFNNAAIECVFVNSRDSEADDALVREEERQGFSRVREILSSHEWPGLRLKPRINTTVCTVAVPNLNNCGNSTMNNAHSNHSSHSRTSTNQDSTLTDDKTAAEFGAFQSALSPTNDGLILSEDIGDGATCRTPPSSQTNCAKSEKRLLDSDTQFQHLMQQLAGQRSRISTMSDEDRRNGAAAAAEQMLQMFGLDDTSDSLSSDDEFRVPS